MFMAATSESVLWLQSLDWEQARLSWQTTVDYVISVIRSTAWDQQREAGRCLLLVLLPGALSEKLPKVDELLEEVVVLFGSLKQQLMTILSSSLEEAGSVLEVLQNTVSALLEAREKLNSLQAYLPYLVMVLRVVHCLLSLCHEVEREKQWALHHLTVNLSDLFKSTYSLLKLSLDDVTAVPLTGSLNLLTQLIAVADVSLTFDPSLPVLCWKAIGKVVCKSKSHLLSHDWSVQPIVSQLCVAMETKYKECSCLSLDETAGSDVQKLLKLCRFLTTLLFKLVQEFESVRYEFADQLVHLLISVHISGKSGFHTSDIEENILIMRDPLVSAMSGCEVFLKSLLAPPADGGHYLAWLDCLLALIKAFPLVPDGLQEYLMAPVSSREEEASGCRLLDSVFLCLVNCHTELSVPGQEKGIMYNGNPMKCISLYELVSIHVCALVQCAQVSYFHTIEMCLLKHLLSQHPHSSLMAMDVWIFMCRLAGENVTKQHIDVLSKLLSSLPDGVQQLTVAMLIQRLLALLSEESQRTFVAGFSPTVTHHLFLWSHINLNTLHKHVASQVCLELANSAMSALNSEMKMAVSNPARVVTILRCLSTIATSSDCSSLPIREFIQFLPSLLTFDPSVMCHTLLLVSFITPLLPSAVLKQVFHELYEVVDTSPEKAITISFFLTHSCTGPFQEDVQDTAIRTIVKCYQVLLSSSHWLACHTALESFKAFAEVTPYSSVVEQCILPLHSEMVVSFLHKVPHCSHTIDESIVKRFLNQQAKDLQDRSSLSLTMQDNKDGPSIISNQDGNNVDGSSCLIPELRECWSKVKALLTHPSQTQREELVDLISDMNSFLQT